MDVQIRAPRQIPQGTCRAACWEKCSLRPFRSD
jgi:hypothetical protein